VVYSEYDLQGDLEIGKKLARKVRASNVALVVAVGLKAALADNRKARRRSGVYARR